MGEETSRTDFGMDEQEFKFETKGNEQKEFLSTKDDYDATIKDPIAVVYSNFYRIFLINERFAFDQFNQLNKLLEEFSNLASIDFYKNMDIVRLSSEIINKYASFVSAMRQNIFWTKDKLDEMRKTTNSLYNLRGQKEEISVNGTLSVVEKSATSFYAVIDKKQEGNFPVGSKVRIYKIRNPEILEEKN